MPNAQTLNALDLTTFVNQLTGQVAADISTAAGNYAVSQGINPATGAPIPPSPTISSVTSSLPSWAIPAMIGVGALVLILAMKRR